MYTLEALLNKIQQLLREDRAIWLAELDVSSYMLLKNSLLVICPYGCATTSVLCRWATVEMRLTSLTS